MPYPDYEQVEKEFNELVMRDESSFGDLEAFLKQALDKAVDDTLDKAEEAIGSEELVRTDREIKGLNSSPFSQWANYRGGYILAKREALTAIRALRGGDK